MASLPTYEQMLKTTPLTAEMTRLERQAARTWPTESHWLTQFGLRDGQRVLDLGCGTGAFTHRLHALCPASPITGVDHNVAWLNKAQQQTPHAAIRWVEATVTETGLPDESFDWVISRFVLRFLPDPMAAIREAMRLLVPGGKLVLIDADDDLAAIIDPPIRPQTGHGPPWRDQSMYRAGRHLIRWLRQADCHNIQFQAIASHSDLLGLDAFSVTAWGDSASQSWQHDFVQNPDALILLMHFLACGEKSSGNSPIPKK
ncbi:class I SAM-dependent methyltransferase [Tuwongella immobilis]|uniref:Methyltransferase type 11 domain-containing protein n=1 Tax=Tuwongella immobilis TaxID=692036 RepID=A0A6C2YXM1_9BACT|nr:class I SAM-dependent methyltransferase [Tuwongella immobilis]VIP05525.1 methyltransferase type 11 : Uncharacterized protein OS=Cyanothece sp. (strain ATCC 51142) GN=cce_3762 PE=4 SV=1: Methyltransf_11 [Tuwongella immobilis]VTS08406.1 methyltransferase type 11 : Uncharacterized protein OS=Cyanothece sp. (strain ATCC 51142) GN=cce_3762 PE=4 SV=1: Methyltransf_11 [Tuwongella immobilis]